MPQLTPKKVGLSRLPCWLRIGWQDFLRAKGGSAAYAALFALLGLVQFCVVVMTGFSPLMVALAGGFLLLGPALLCGFFHVSDALEQGRPVHLSNFFTGFQLAPPALWVIALLEMFLFLVWLTDAGVMYGMYFGMSSKMGLPEFLAGLMGQGNTWPYLFFSGLMGMVLAFIIYATAAFSVPLLFYRRANLVTAVSASVRATFANFITMLAWGVFLSITMFTAMLLLLPLFPLVFPVLAYASKQAYREVFPQQM